MTDEQRELLQSVATSDDWAINIFATLVRHPGLFRQWLPFGGKLLAGKLPARERELMILRTGWRTRVVKMLEAPACESTPPSSSLASAVCSSGVSGSRRGLVGRSDMPATLVT